MALDDDLDSWHEAPPRLSMLPDGDDDVTVKSLEAGRRALLNDPRRRISRGIPESFTLGDTEVDAEAIAAAEEEDAFLGGEMDGEEGLEYNDYDQDDGGETGELRAMIEEAARRRSSRPSGMYEQEASPGTDGEPTFVFRIPERRRETIAGPLDFEADRDGGEEPDDKEPAIAGAEEADGIDEEAYAEHYAESEAEDTVNLATLAGDAAARKVTAKASRERILREKMISRHGLEYPSFPAGVVKRVASTFARNFTGNGKLNKEALVAMQKASDWFFEQVSGDLGTYARHAGRKTIEEADVITLMKRYVSLSLPYILVQFWHFFCLHNCTDSDN
jgi:histone H3/H4